MPTGITDHLHLDSPYLLCPSIAGSLLAWNESRSGNWDVYVMDLDTGIEEQITSDSYDQIAMEIGGQLLLWLDYRHTQGAYPAEQRDLYLYDISTGISRRLTTESLRWGYLSPVSCQWMIYVEILGDYHYRLYAWDLQAAGVSDGDCHVIPCDPMTETCGVIEWRGL